MAKIIGAILLFLISAFSFALSAHSFNERGILLNNAYIYATKKEREEMNKKPYYRQSAIVFLLIGLIFLLNGLQILLKVDWIFYIVLLIMAITIVYAVISSISIEKNNKNQ